MGRFLVIFTLVSAALVGGGVYYAQVYAFYDKLPEDTEIRLTSLESGQPEAILAEDFQGIDANSSPLRFRACFRTPQSVAMMSETYVAYEDPVPLNAPKWFSCFDAAHIGADLESGEAVAFLSQANITYGIDRVVAVYEDGRAFSWHQINRCGEEVFNGRPAPDGCPIPPKRSQ